MDKSEQTTAYSVEDLINILSRHNLDLPVYVWSSRLNRYMPVMVEEITHIDGRKRVILR